jgi:hypothetical protein
MPVKTSSRRMKPRPWNRLLPNCVITCTAAKSASSHSSETLTRSVCLLLVCYKLTLQLSLGLITPFQCRQGLTYADINLGDTEFSLLCKKYVKQTKENLYHFHYPALLQDLEKETDSQQFIPKTESLVPLTVQVKQEKEQSYEDLVAYLRKKVI